ncbi:unnamed protein product [Sphenostylis stenocarpa]|uniref:Uncharacterized protein n=1 Tax=Sphenostylis stenocarpa TaxID=92480 RepID=A0AA86VY24_9FABA|nr:unnamed protein product [Sphenostylis stenocarpa]
MNRITRVLKHELAILTHFNSNQPLNASNLGIPKQNHWLIALLSPQRPQSQGQTRKPVPVLSKTGFGSRKPGAYFLTFKNQCRVDPFTPQYVAIRPHWFSTRAATRLLFAPQNLRDPGIYYFPIMSDVSHVDRK